MNNIKDIPEIMASQRAEKKKDRYIELTDRLLKAEGSAVSRDEKEEYISIVEKTLENMDFQIYELYRSLQDAAERVKSSLEERCDPMEELMRGVSVNTVLISAREKGRGAGDLKVLRITPRSAVLQLPDAGKFRSEKAYTIYVNGREWGKSETVITSIFDLLPDTSYVVEAVSDGPDVSYSVVCFRTSYEYVTINVKDVGAAGDGVQDDTTYIQAAIMACPDNGRVLIPEGTYLIRSIFIKDNLNLELAQGARLLARTDREAFARFPGVIRTSDGKDEYMPGTWEGNPLPMFAGVLCGYNASNVNIYGRGILDGGASRENWWKSPKELNIAYRPRLFFINGCKNVTLQGLTLQNSPSWTIHPFFSDDLGFFNVTVKNPSDSPNTDGLDPESCRRVEIAGVKFSLGDDCIAVKSGKIYTGRKYKRPSEQLHIHHCLMENGHGAVTVGSEVAGGVRDMRVEDCEFSHTDRGLRIKTRRGRGKDSVLDGIAFRRIDMDNVMTPFCINAFYFCDPDGKTDYVQSRSAFRVDERTPELKRFVFEDIDAKNCHVAATYFEGLPEKKIEEVIFRNVSVTYSDSPVKGQPIMSSGVEECTLKGLYVKNVVRLVLDNVSIEGQEGEKIMAEDIDIIEGDI